MQVTINERDKTVTMTLEDFYRHFTSGEDLQAIQVKPVAIQSSGNLESQVTNLLSQIGMPRNIQGFSYVRQAIILAVHNPKIMERVTKELYTIMAKNNGTTPSRVERAIRHAIEVAWDRGNMEVINSLFGYSVSPIKSKATNSEFIALLADHIRLQLKDGVHEDYGKQND